MNIKNKNDISTNDKRKFFINIIEKVFNELSPEKIINKKFNPDFNEYNNIYVIGFGKASFKMYSGIRNKIIGKVKYAGIIVPEDENDKNAYSELNILKGTHPYISELSVNSSRELLSNLKDLNENDLVIVLISGGGSSLFEIPVDNVSANDIMNISKEIMKNGGDIYSLNYMRSVLSDVKNGKLSKYLYPANIVSYIISDVIYDDLSIIASGPLKQTDNDFNINKLLNKYIKDDKLKNIIINNYKNYKIENKYFKKITNNIILKNNDFVNKFYEYMDTNSINLGSNINGDVDDVSGELAKVLRSVYSIKKSSFSFVGGGETTVNVRGNGRGGRNQELVLRLLKNMKNNENFVFVSIGTDGIDGMSNAAGGIVDNTTKISDLEYYLNNNDSYTALLKNHGVIITGRTGNNVSDIIMGYYSENNI